MNIHLSYALAAVLIVGTISTVSASAQLLGGGDEALVPTQQKAVAIQTDSAIYDHDSTIMVSGQVMNTKFGVPITLRVIEPIHNNVVMVRQVNADANGSFEIGLNTAGDLWKYDGTYTIEVYYGSPGTYDRVLVELTGGEIPVERPVQVTCGASEVAAADQCVPFSITGGTVTGADVNHKDKALEIYIDAREDGELVLRPSEDTIGGIFLVFVDDEQWDDVVIDGNTVTVMFLAGAEKVAIVGTYVIPEFGTIAVLVLAVAIVSIIAVTSRSRLGIMPRL